MKINKYPDGSSYVTIPEKWENTYQKLVFKINTYEDVIHLLQLCDVLTYNNIITEITIPCLLDAQADKRFNNNESSGLKVLLNLLKDTEDNIYFKIFHPHNPEVVEAIIPNVNIIDNSEFIKNVLYDIEIDITVNKGNDFYPNNLILMSADAGGFKPLIKLCNKIGWKGETYSASKAREFHMGETILVQKIDKQNFDGKDILIVDDICVYGSTFKNLAKMLRERNCGKLYLAVSHMTVQNLGEDLVTNYFDKVFTTNSKFDKYWDMTEKQPNNLEIIKMF